MKMKEPKLQATLAMGKGLESRLLERGIETDELRRLRLTNSQLEELASMPVLKARQALMDIQRAGMLLKAQKQANELVIAFPSKWEEKLDEARKIQFEVPNMPEEAAVRIVIFQKKPEEFVAKIEREMQATGIGNMLKREEAFMLAANHPNDFEDYATLASEAGRTRVGGHVVANCRSGNRLSAMGKQVPVFLRALSITQNMTFNEVKSLTKNIHRDPVADAELLEKHMEEMPGFSKHFCKMLIKFSPESRQRLIGEAVWLYSELPALTFYDCQKIAANHSRILYGFAECFKEASALPSAEKMTKKELIDSALGMAREREMPKLPPLMR